MIQNSAIPRFGITSDPTGAYFVSCGAGGHFALATSAWVSCRYRFGSGTMVGYERLFNDEYNPMLVQFESSRTALYVYVLNSDGVLHYTGCLVSNTNFAAGKLSTVVFQFNGNEATATNRLRIYVDNREITRFATGMDDFGTMLHTGMTWRKITFARNLNTAMMHEVRMGTDVLTADQRSVLHNAGFGQPQSLRGIIPYMTNEWLMYEGTGTFVRDYVGKNNGTMITNVNWVRI